MQKKKVNSFLFYFVLFSFIFFLAGLDSFKWPRWRQDPRPARGARRTRAGEGTESETAAAAAVGTGIDATMTTAATGRARYPVNPSSIIQFIQLQSQLCAVVHRFDQPIY
jgi:hypothetical protein